MRGILQDNCAILELLELSEPIKTLNISTPMSFNYYNTKFYIAKLGFFDPFFNGKSSITSVEVEYTPRNTYF